MTTDVVRSVLVSRDPAVHGGDTVFVGTRVPVDTLIDYLEGGYDLDEFLDHFPTVTREQAVAALARANELLAAHAHSA